MTTEQKLALKYVESLTVGYSHDSVIGFHLRTVLAMAKTNMWRPIAEATPFGGPYLVCGGEYMDSSEFGSDWSSSEGIGVSKVWSLTRLDGEDVWMGDCSGYHDEYFYHKPTHFMEMPNIHVK